MGMEFCGMGYAPNRVLVVEDEHLLALWMMDSLSEIGCDALGPAYTILAARRLALGATFDAAIIDWNMRGTPSTEIANILSSRQIPFLFVTGYLELPFEGRTAVVLNKPFTCEELQEAVQNLLGPQRASRQTTTADESGTGITPQAPMDD
jgi:DNA-binding response OmpR family regulator